MRSGLLLAGLLIFVPTARGQQPQPAQQQQQQPATQKPRRSPVKVVKEHYSLTVSAGLSSISYQENGYASLSEIAVTPKLSYRLLLPVPHCDFGLSGYATALALHSNLPGVTARFIGLNARVGYGGLEILPYPWKFSLMGGLYYTTMAVQGSPFGFSGLFGPQIYPAIRYGLDLKDTLSGAFKYSPIGTFFSTSNREIALDFAWTRSLGDTTSFLLTLDLADLRFASDGSSAVSQSATLSAGYGW